MTMIEKVARAIARSIDIDPDDGRAEDAMKWIRITAKAAIEAMREPSDEMIIAADIYVEDGSEWGKQKTIVEGYQQMIDAALKED